MPEKNLDIFNLKNIQVNRSKDQLIEQGIKQQERIPSSELIKFHKPDRDPVAAIQQTESNMIQELLPMRHERMMASPFAFFRGTAELMEDDLKEQGQSNIPIIICGDAHVQNYGFYASPERNLLFGLNDFDEARIGNWESDVKRLLVSAQLAGEENGFDQDDLDHILKHISKTYRHSIKRASKVSLMDQFYYSFKYQDMVDMIQGFGDDTPAAIQKVMQKILKKSQRSNSEQIVQKMAVEDEHQEYHFVDNPPRAKHVSLRRYQELLVGFHRYRQNVSPDVQVFLANYHISDIIRYSVGVGSFGTRCYLFLLTDNDGTHLVLQMKEAVPLRYNLLRLRVNEAIANGQRAGRRIVTSQRTLQSSSDPFLAATNFAGRSYYIRQFRDMKESVNVSKLDLESFNLYCETCAVLLAVAHSQSPTSPIVRGYLKHQKVLDNGLADWAVEYANLVHQDYAKMAEYLKQEGQNK